MGRFFALAPVSSSKNDPRLYKSEMDQLHVGEGNWVRIQYGGRKASRKAFSIDRRDEWSDHLIFLNEADIKDLHLPGAVNSADPTQPPSGVSVEVSKLLIPRDGKAYLILAAFVVAVITAAVGFVKGSLPTASPLNETYALIQLVLATITATIATVAAYAQLQPG